MKVSGHETNSSNFQQISNPKQTFSLLNLAVKEEDPEKRFDSIVKACKSITDVIPKEDKIAIFYEQRDFIFYLIVLEIFHPRIVKDIMNALIMRLNSYSGFIPIFYDSLVEVGRCCEIYSERLEFKKDLGASILEYNIHSPRKELCRDIISRIVEIKKIGLGYWDEFLKGRLRLIYVNYRPLDLFKIWLSFVMHTKEESIIRKACEILEMILNDKFGEKLVQQKEFALQAVEANRRGAHYVMKIFHTFLKSGNAVKSPSKLSSPLRTKSMINMSPSLLSSGIFSRGQISQKKFYDGNFNILDEDQEKKFDFQPAELEDEETPQEIPDKEDSVDIEVLQNNFEEWLFENDILIMNENDETLEFFEFEESYEIIFNVLLNPLQTECSEKLKIFSDKALKIIQNNKERYLGAFFSSIDLEGIKETELEKHKPQITPSTYLHIVRAFKYQQVLLQPENWREIKMLKPNFVSDFYSRLHQEMRKVNPCININLVMELVDFFLKQDPEQSIINIIQYNFPFILLWNIQEEIVQKITCRLVNLAENYYDLSFLNVIKLTRYYRYTDFFFEYVKLILYSDYSVDFRKSAVNYKPPELHKVYRLNKKLMLQVGEKGGQSHRGGLLAINLIEQEKIEGNPYQLAEERFNLNSDIDGIQPFLTEKEPPIPSPISNKKLDQPERRANSVPRLHFESILSKHKIPYLVDNKMSDSSYRVSVQGNKPVKAYPSLLESLMRTEPSSTERPDPAKGSKTTNNTSFSAMRNPYAERSELQKGRPSTHNVENKITNSFAPPIIQKQRPSSQSSRPASSFRKQYPFFSTQSEIKSVNNSRSFLTESEFKKGDRPNTGRLPLLYDQPQKSFRLESRESQSISIGGGNKSAETNLHASQSIMNVYSLPSKSSRIGLKEPKLYSFKPESAISVGLELLSQKESFQEKAIRANEKRVLSLSFCLLNLVQEYFQKFTQSKLMTMIGAKDLSHLKVIKGLEGKMGIQYFSTLFQSYLIKMSKLKGECDTSGYYCGEIVNEILSRLFTHKALENHRADVHNECCEGIGFLCTVITESIKWKNTEKPKLYLQNYIVHETLGSSRLMLIRTLNYILVNDQEQNYTVVNNVTEQSWQILVFWFTDLKHQNTFQNLALKIFEVGLKYGSEELVLLILLKANLLSPLLVSYRDIYQNKILMKKLHIDNYMNCLIKVVNYVQYIEQERKNLAKVIALLSNLQSWIELKKEFILKQPFLPPSFPTSPTALPPCVFYPIKSSPKEKNTKGRKSLGPTKTQGSQEVIKKERRVWTNKGPIVKIVNLRDLSEGKIRTRRKDSQIIETNNSIQKEGFEQKRSGEIKARSHSLKINEKESQNYDKSKK